jgi:hypothetical protein
MTLYLEFYDSVSSSILGRVVDRKTARSNGMMQISNRVTNKAEADRMFKKWTSLLIAKMDAVMGKDE